MGCKRAMATPVLTVSATAKASSASKVQSLSGSVRCVASSAKPLVLRLPNIDPDQVSAVQTDDDEGIEQVEANGRDNEQIHGSNVRGVVPQKGAPSLTWRPASLEHVLCDARLRD